jgi:BCD family chlorophyll transporter-like MFS transporter
VALGGILRDIVGALASQGIFGADLAVPATGYAFVYAVEIVLLMATLVVMGGLVGGRRDVALAPGLPVGATKS